MEQAIVGLVGVIIGGVLSGLRPYVLAARAETTARTGRLSGRTHPERQALW